MRVIPLTLTIVLVLAHYTLPLAVEAQQAPRVARVGILGGGGSLFQAGLESFRQRMRGLGYVEDQTIVLFVRNAEGRTERYRELAAELVQLRVDVIVVQGNAALVALKQATPTIPIVMANMAEDIGQKWVELLKEVSPKVTRLAVLWDSRNAPHVSMWREIQIAAQALSVTPLAWEVRGPDES